MTNKPVTKEDVIQMMHSVVSVSADIYPESYETDANFMKMIYPYIIGKGINPLAGTFNIEISYNDLLKCVDETYGIRKYLNEFHNNFEIELGIETNYDNLMKKYSSIEILLLYGVFKNLVYANITVHAENDTRPKRDICVTGMKLPDLKINVMSIKLRDYCDQHITDMINKYIISNTGFIDNVMSRKNVFMTERVSDFFTLLDETFKDTELFELMYKLFSFLDIDEIQDVILLVVTDWPVL